MRHHHDRPSQTDHQEGVMRDIQDALSSAWGKVALGVASIGLAAAASGCSPKELSYWTGNYTQMPDPPVAARMQTGVSTESDGDLFINYVVWNDTAKQFERHDIHYTAGKLGNMVQVGDFREAGGYKQRIKHGEVLTGGAVIDQRAGLIRFPDGSRVDGPSGTYLSAHGDTITTLEP